MNSGLKSADHTKKDSCTILACQLSIPQTLTKVERQHHITKTVEKIDMSLVQRSADIVVLPELSTIDYSRRAFEQLNQLAEPLDGPSMDRMCELALRHQSAIVFGMPRKQEGRYLISQLIISANGELLACYDKLHICQYGASMEKEFFQRGNHLEVFEVAGFRFAPIICYDIRFPELCRSLTLKHDVDCILHCGAYYRDESFESWHACARTRAIENQIYLLSLNRAGQQYGNSLFCLPWMDELNPATGFESTREDFRYLTLERSRIQQTREQYTFLNDRLENYDFMPVGGSGASAKCDNVNV